MSALELSLRPARPGDEPFLLSLFTEIKMAEFGGLPLSPQQLEQLMRMQFESRNQSYHARYPAADQAIVMDGEVPIGLLWVQRSADSIHLMDISIVAARRNQGIGRRLLQALVAEATAARLPLRCHVACSNQGSLRFHQRLGFEVAATDGVYFELEFISRF